VAWRGIDSWRFFQFSSKAIDFGIVAPFNRP